MISIPQHTRRNNSLLVPLKHVIPRYRLLTGSNTNWNSLLWENAFTVGGIDSNFVSIQDCLNEAPVDSIIIVYPGHYNESLVVTKPVTLMSVGDILLTSPVTISASHVTLDGFTIDSNDEYKSLVAIDGSHIQIQNCMFTGRYFVGQSVELHKINTAVSCQDCQHVKIINNIFSHNVFAVHLINAKHMTVKSNIFNYGQVSIVMQMVTDVYISGNLFEFNRDVAQYDVSGSYVVFENNVYHDNLQSNVCQYENVFDYWSEIEFENCPYLNISSTVTARHAIKPSNQLFYTGWCDSNILTNYTNILQVEEELYSHSGCIALLGGIVATASPQGLHLLVSTAYIMISFRKLLTSYISIGNTSFV